MKRIVEEFLYFSTVALIVVGMIWLALAPAGDHSFFGGIVHIHLK